MESSTPSCTNPDVAKPKVGERTVDALGIVDKVTNVPISIARDQEDVSIQYNRPPMGVATCTKGPDAKLRAHVDTTVQSSDTILAPEKVLVESNAPKLDHPIIKSTAEEVILKYSDPITGRQIATDANAPVPVALTVPLEPPAKRLKVNDPSSEATTPVVSNVEATASLGAPSTTPTAAMASPKPVTTNTNTNNYQSVTSTTQLLLPDYAAVRQTVKDLLSMLQLYGPLTANQLEYNLPPVTAVSTPWNVHDILAILVAIGLVQHVKGTTDQYCMFGGVPRATAIYPTDIPSEIKRAINEVEQSYKCCQILKEALRQANPASTSNQNGTNRPTRSYKDVLQQLMQDFPHTTNDPVYRTAVRSCHGDMGNGSMHLSMTEKRSSTAFKSNNPSKGTSKANNKSASSVNIKDGGKSTNRKALRVDKESSRNIIGGIQKSLPTSTLVPVAQADNATAASMQVRPMPSAPTVSVIPVAQANAATAATIQIRPMPPAALLATTTPIDEVGNEQPKVSEVPQIIKRQSIATNSSSTLLLQASTLSTKETMADSSNNSTTQIAANDAKGGIPTRQE
jgi:hypothetical protein